MKRITIVGYYQLKESLKSMADSLSQLNYIVSSYPLYQYAYDSNDKKENYQEHFKNFIVKSEPDIILWWFIDVPVVIFSIIKSISAKIYHIYFDNDIPTIWDNNINNFRSKCTYFDLIISTCQESVNTYLSCGIKDALFCVSGFDPKDHYIIHDKEYICDVSFLCDSLYENKDIYPNQFIDRRELLENLIKNDIKVNIYGPEDLRKTFPNNYRGKIFYEDTRSIFNKSRINLVTHVRCDKYMYINENISRVLGSGGLLLVDRVNGIDKIVEPIKECVIMDKNYYIDQIKRILSRYDDYEIIKRNGYNRAQKQYKWDDVALLLYQRINEHFFDPTHYKSICNIPPNIKELKDLKTHWKRYSRLVIPYKIEIPHNFNFVQYRKDKNISGSNEILFSHALYNKEVDKYIAKISPATNEILEQNNLSEVIEVEQYNISYVSFIDIQKSFLKIEFRQNIDIALKEIELMCEANPTIKINDLLKIHMSSRTKN